MSPMQSPKALALVLLLLSMAAPACSDDDRNSQGDASIRDASQSDTGPLDAAGQDASPPRPTCAVENGGCDPLVTCTDGPSGPECGPCPAPYVDDGQGGCACRETGLWNETGSVQPRPMPDDLTNIALGASYTMDPAPNYSLCTDPGDAVQLTDGQYTSGYFWTQASTVGWVNKSPVIVIDLGSDRPIKGLSYNTAAGTAGVHWPTAIEIFVAGPDQQFHAIGNLVPLHERHDTIPSDGYAIHKYWTDELHTHGRYLAIGVLGVPYIFVDEIEVFAGDDSWLTEPIQGPLVSDLHQGITDQAVRDRTMRRYMTDMRSILDKADAIPVSQDIHDEIVCEWDSALALLQNKEPGPDFRAVLPFDGLHRRILSVQARLWRLQGSADMLVWTSPAWDFLPYLSDPPQQADPSLSVQLMRQEYRAAQLNVTNAAERSKQVSLSFEGLPDALLTHLSVRQVAWTDTANGIPVSDALPKATGSQGNWSIEVPSGMTRQIWLTFFVADQIEGTFEGNVVLDDGTHETKVPISVQVYPFTFPAERHLHLGGWDYTNQVPSRGITEQNRDAVVAHLVDHFVDRPWATSTVMPHGQFDSSGHLITEPDTTNMDQWLDLWAGADRYNVFLAVSDSFAGMDMASQSFHTAVGEWADFWAQHLQSRGLTPDRLALLLVDEPHDAAQAATITAWADAIHDSDSGILVWEDPTWRDVQDIDQTMIASCDILCPNRQVFLAGGSNYAQFFANARDAGATLEFYSCSGPMRLLDPYSYIRMQAWTAWQYRATAMYFWAFSDNGGASAWNEYALVSSRDYSPSFLDPTSITTSKHMEAIREGIEDYEYLFMLSQAIQDAEQRGVDAALLQQARDLLDQLPGEVLPAPDATIQWADPLDRTGADEARGRILDMLAALAE